MNALDRRLNVYRAVKEKLQLLKYPKHERLLPGVSSQTTMPWQDIFSYKHLSNGKFGETYVGTMHGAPQNKAVLKIVPLTQKQRKDVRNRKHGPWREIENMKLMTKTVLKRTCPNLPTLITWGISDVCTTQKTMRNLSTKTTPCAYFLSDCGVTTLAQFVKKSGKTPIKSEMWLSFIFQILAGVHVLHHSMNMIHGDLHWENIVLYEAPSSGVICYIIDGVSFYIPLHGYLLVLIDLGHTLTLADLGVNEIDALPSTVSHNTGSTSSSLFPRTFLSRKTDLAKEFKKIQHKDVERACNVEKAWTKHGIKRNIPATLDKMHTNLVNARKKRDYATTRQVFATFMHPFIDPRLGMQLSALQLAKEFDFGTDCARGRFVCFKNKLCIIKHIDVATANIVLMVSPTATVTLAPMDTKKIKLFTVRENELPPLKYKVFEQYTL